MLTARNSKTNGIFDMYERKPWYFRFRKFSGPLIMTEGKFYEYKDNLFKQIEYLLEMDGGFAQTCHCSEPCHCEEYRIAWNKEREEIVANIRKALMI